MEKNKNGIKFYLIIALVVAVIAVTAVVLVSRGNGKEETNTKPTESLLETSGEGIMDKETEDGNADGDTESQTKDSVIPQEQTTMPPVETKTEPVTETEPESVSMPERETITLPPTEEDTQKQTEAPTQKPTEPTTEKTTQKPTEPATEKPTEKPTEPATEKPTEKPTEPPTEAPTQPPVKTDEQKFKEAGGKYRINDDGTVTITGGENINGHLVIPAVIDGRKVKDIEINSFFGLLYKSNNITSLEIHAEIVGGNAFGCCASLTSIVLGPEVKEIGIAAFKECTNLTSVTFDTNQLTYLPDRVFSECKNLASITLPAGITSVDAHFMYVSPRGYGPIITDVVPITLYVEAKRGTISAVGHYLPDPYDLEAAFEFTRAYPDSRVTVVYVNG